MVKKKVGFEREASVSGLGFGHDAATFLRPCFAPGSDVQYENGVVTSVRERNLSNGCANCQGKGGPKHNLSNRKAPNTQFVKQKGGLGHNLSSGPREPGAPVVHSFFYSAPGPRFMRRELSRTTATTLFSSSDRSVRLGAAPWQLFIIRLNSSLLN